MHSENSFRCLACRGQESAAVFTDCQDYYVGKTFRADYHRCLNCGLVQQAPTPCDVSSFYEAYPVHAPKSFLHTALRALRFKNYWKTNGCKPGTVLLDYGCGDGSYLATQAGGSVERIGFEPSASLADALASTLGVPVYSDIEKLMAECAGKVDVVTMHFVLEHLTDLHAGFANASRLLRPGGTFYFLIPQINSWEARLFRKKWHNLDPPRHISFPEPEVVQRLAEEHGLALVRHKGIAFPNGIAGSLPVVLTGKFRYPLFMFSFPLAILLSNLAPTGCRAFWLSKR